MSKVEKTRNQSLYEYLESLQLEYIQAELRRKIYWKKKDKRFWSKVLEFKKEKIEDIVSRNGLPSIFNDDIVREQLRRKVINDIGFPTFVYRNEEELFSLGETDFRCYFNLNAEVKVLIGNGRVGIGKIVKVPELGDDVIEVKLRGDSISRKFYIKYVTRIL